MAVDLRRDRFDSTVLFTLVLISIVAILVNYPVHYVPAGTRLWQNSFEYGGFYDAHEVLYFDYFQAGFPVVWASQPDGEETTELQWSGIKLLINISFWAMIAGLTVWIVSRIRHHLHLIRSSKQWFNCLRRAETWVLVVILLTIVGLGGQQWLRVKKDQQIAEALMPHGIVVTYAMMPRPLARTLPLSIAQCFSRIREVVIWSPDDDCLQQLARIDTLKSLVLVESKRTSEAIAGIAKPQELRSLSLREQTLTSDQLKSIGRLTQLRTLDLRRCVGLQDWDCNLPINYLTDLRVTHCDLQLARARLDRYRASLQSLSLSRRKSGADQFKLVNFPRLTRLNLSRNGSSVNHHPLQIELQDMPALGDLAVDTDQLMDLKIVRAPALAAISYIDERGDFGWRSSNAGTSAPMFRHLELHAIPSLSELAIDGMHLQHIQYHQASSLKRLSIGRENVVSPQDMKSHTGIFATHRQQVIKDIGNLDGPPSLDFRSMPFGGLDLTPLQNNRRLKSLAMVRCGIDDQQAMQISAIKNLTSIDLRGCPISDQQAIKLLQRDGALENLLVNASDYETIEIIDQSRLKTFFASDAVNAVRVHIKDAPYLRAELLLGGRLESLNIENARSLSGLAIDGPLPPACAIQGLRALKFFAVGGLQATDELCRSVWQCSDLDHLTVAYGALTGRSLERIGSLKKLTVLCLPGSELNDQIVTNHWRDLQFLSHVNLSETQISSSTVRWLCSQKNLQQLAINYCPVDRRTLATLADVGQLIELEVAGIGLDAPVLERCLDRSLLDRLNLSDCPLTPEHVALLASSRAKNIRFLGLANCGLSDDQLRQIVEGNPQVAVDIEGNAISEALHDSLQSAGRLVSRYNRRQFLEYLASGRNLGNSNPLDSIDNIRGRIDDHQFVSRDK